MFAAAVVATTTNMLLLVFKVSIDLYYEHKLILASLFNKQVRLLLKCEQDAGHG